MKQGSRVEAVHCDLLAFCFFCVVVVMATFVSSWDDTGLSAAVREEPDAVRLVSSIRVL